MSGTPLCPGLRCVVLAAAEGSLHVCLLALVDLDEPLLDSHFPSTTTCAQAFCVEPGALSPGA